MHPKLTKRLIRGIKFLAKKSHSDHHEGEPLKTAHENGIDTETPSLNQNQKLPQHTQKQSKKTTLSSVTPVKIPTSQRQSRQNTKTHLSVYTETTSAEFSPTSHSQNQNLLYLGKHTTNTQRHNPENTSNRAFYLRKNNTQ